MYHEIGVSEFLNSGGDERAVGIPRQIRPHQDQDDEDAPWLDEALSEGDAWLADSLDDEGIRR